jgi:hypothetical protein
VKDYQAALEKLRTDAADAAMIRDLATDRAKREMFDRLAQHLGQLADDVERAMSEPEDKPSRVDQARQVVEEYASDQRGLIKQLGKSN